MGSQASPSPSPSLSSWSELVVSGQLSLASQTPSPAASSSGVPQIPSRPNRSMLSSNVLQMPSKPSATSESGRPSSVKPSQLLSRPSQISTGGAPAWQMPARQVSVPLQGSPSSHSGSLLHRAVMVNSRRTVPLVSVKGLRTGEPGACVCEMACTTCWPGSVRVSCVTSVLGLVNTIGSGPES